MTRLTLLLLVDAFRHDYVDRTRYIRQLAATSRTGSLREDFGFLPRAAYFGGLTPQQARFTNMYSCDATASPFGVARGLPASARGRSVEEIFGIRTAIEERARTLVTPFAATYLSTAEIPLELLPNFDLVEKYAPWDPHVGYRTIFDGLRERAIPYFYCGWPETNRLPDHSDAAIVSTTLATVRPPMQFAFVHLQELDGVGHAYGPESREILAALSATDSRVESLMTELRRRFDRVDLVLFGDHGMVPVTGTTDVWAALEAAELTPGRDVVFFLDSTMARFWPATRGIGARIVRALAPLPGRVLDDEALDRLELRGCDPRNGEIYFLAHPGVLIMPNFFQRRGQPVLGMHGYEPDCPDNQGIFLVHEHDGTKREALGVVRPTRIHQAVSELLGLAPAETRTAHLPVAAHSFAFTQHPDPAANRLVTDHMMRIVAETHGTVPGASAILLTGSFGRGEGGVTRGADGRFRPVNDYDVLVVSAAASGTDADRLRELGLALAREFETDFVHFGLFPSIEALSAPTLATYEVKYGSSVLWGNRALLDALPRWAARDIPLLEGVQLLFNRLAGVLTALKPSTLDHPGMDQQYRTNQIMKALMAVGDWYLLRHGAYDASYRRRLERFSWLAPGLPLPARAADLITLAYRYKLHPDSVDAVIPNGVQLATLWLVQAAIDAVGRTTGRPIDSAVEAATAYYDMTSRDHGQIETDNAFARRMLNDDAIVQVQDEPVGSVRQAIYASLPLVAAGSLGDGQAFAAASRRLTTCLTPPWPSDLTLDNWNLVRHRLSHAWLTLVH